MTDHGRCDPNTIAAFLRRIHPDGNCFEIRAPNSLDRPGTSFRATTAGYYDDIDRAAAHVAELDDEGVAPAIYVTLNSVNPALLARHNNRMGFKVRELTKAADVVRRRTLLLDFDPVRPAGTSSTESELRAALDLASAVRAQLRESGWPEPIYGSSGNGGHLVFGLDLEPTSDLVERVIEAISARYSTEAVKVDSSVHDAGRITKILGTITRKGDELLDVVPELQRPHRRSEMIEAPDHLIPVPQQLLEAVAARTGAASSSGAAPKSTVGSSTSPSVEGWVARLESHGASIKGMRRRDDSTLILLDECIVDPTIKSTGQSDIALLIGDNGDCGYSNLHDRGRAYTIADVLRNIDPGGLDIGADAKHKRDKKASQADRLVALGRAADLFHSTACADPEAYATLSMDKRHETWPVRSKQYERWLSQRYFDTQSKSPTREAMRSAIGTLEAMALFGGSSRDTAVRVHETPEAIYVDLCDLQWRAVRITAFGWDVVDHAQLDFHFVRRRGMEALPVPQHGGSIEEFREFINVSDESTWMLIVAYMVMALSGRGPFPVLAITGEQGSAKSTLARLIRALIDPNLSELRSPPRDERDLVIAARNSHLLAFDNLSGLKPELADAICRMSTGSGFGTRELYTDDEEVLFSVQRPVMINGIDDLATRSDLADRSLFIHLERIESTERITERILWERFEDRRPFILGALCAAVSCALRNRKEVRLKTMPRMADFVTCVVAACESFGWDPDEFLAAYNQNREESFRNAVESSALGPLIIRFIEESGTWKGTAQDLLTEISSARYRALRPQTDHGWPRSPRGMGGALRRIAPALTSLGYIVRFERVGAGRATRRLIKLAAPPNTLVEGAA